MVRSVERAIDVLDLLVPPRRALSLSQISRALRAPKSTVLTIVRSLVARGVLAVDRETKTYRLGLGLTRYSAPGPPSTPLSALAKPHLDELCQKTQETAFLAVVEGDAVFYTSKVDSPQPVQYLAHLGVRRPLHATASGKIALAYMSDAGIRGYIRRHGLKRYTPNTITKTAGLLRELRQIRRNGYALNTGEFFPDLFGIGAPVKDSSGVVIASVNLGGPLFRLHRRTREFAAAVVEAAAALSADVRQLGGGIRVTE